MKIRIVRAIAMITAFAGAPLYAAELRSLSWEGDALRVEVKGKPGFSTVVLDDGKRLRVVLPNTTLASSAADIAGKGIVRGVFPYRAPEGNSTYIDFLMGGAGHLAGKETSYGYRIVATPGGNTTHASRSAPSPSTARATTKPKATKARPAASKAVSRKARPAPPPAVTSVAAAAQGTRPASGGGAVPAGLNTLQSIDHVRLSGGRVQIKLQMARKPDEPGTFSTRRPPRIAFDFFNTRSALGNKTFKLEGAGTLQSISAVQANNRTRVVLNLLEPTTYESRIEPDGMTIIVQAATEDIATRASKSTRFAPGRPGKHTLEKVDFRRGPEGSGRVIVALSDDNVGINLREEPGEITIDFLDVSLPGALEKRLDVLDFATPVQTVDTFRRGTSVRVVVKAVGKYEQSAFQAGNVFTISVKPVIEEEKAEVDEFGYSGQKLSLNFQNIQVRAALQVIADFTGLNFVTSDAVSGELTLRLRDVPWDQALDIILRTKGLAKRESGNVVWVAPADEIAAREKQQLEASKATSDLEPLISELIRINYAKATDIAALLKSIKAVGPQVASTPFTSVSIGTVETETNALLSARGSVTVDERTNSVLIQDTPTKILEVKKLIAKLDKPVPQVMIETRIVEANDDFSKVLGARLGLTNINPMTNLPGQSEQNLGEGIVTGRLEGNVETHNSVNDPSADGSLGIPVTGPGLNVDLPASNIGQETAGAIALTLFKVGAGTAATLLSLELSALEAEGRGKIIANPRLVTTNQKEARIEQGQQQVIPPTGLSQRPTIVEAKLSLTVTPQITPENSVILDVAVTQDTFVNLAAATGVAAVNTKQITTQVLLGNGETVVIGGIYQEDNSETVTKVPLLGDLPLIGALFRTRSRTVDRTELLIFLTPRILDPALNLTSR